MTNMTDYSLKSPPLIKFLSAIYMGMKVIRNFEIDIMYVTVVSV